MDEVRLYEMYLNEAIEERKTDLINRNEEYKNLREKFNDIMNKYPNLQFILEDREMILNETECKMLQKLVKIYIEICDFEEKEIFLLGGKEMYFYLKDTGVIKKNKSHLVTIKVLFKKRFQMRFLLFLYLFFKK